MPSNLSKSRAWCFLEAINIFVFTILRSSSVIYSNRRYLLYHFMNEIARKLFTRRRNFSSCYCLVINSHFPQQLSSSKYHKKLYYTKMLLTERLSPVDIVNFSMGNMLRWTCGKNKKFTGHRGQFKWPSLVVSGCVILEDVLKRCLSDW